MWWTYNKTTKKAKNQGEEFVVQEENAKNLIIIFHSFAAKIDKYASQGGDSLLISSMGHVIWRPEKPGTLSLQEHYNFL